VKDKKMVQAKKKKLIITSSWAMKGFLLGLNLIVAFLIGWPTSGLAADGYWWGSAITPGFDPSAVIQVEGTVKTVSLETTRGMSSLLLESVDGAYQVMIAPGWYLKDQQWDIQSGDLIKVEGSRMTDAKGKLYLVASRITNQRTGTLFELRDDQGNPRWRGERSPRRFRR
jgi:hypothetical protein